MLPETSKTVFWAMTIATLGVLSIPSAILWEAVQGYRGFLSGFEPPARPRTLRPRSLPHGGGRADPGERAGALQFSEFSLKAPKARQVSLLADFSRWRKDALRLSKQADGAWEILVPLPPGRYHYLFLVDGETRLDPANPKTERAGPGLSSVRVIP